MRKLTGASICLAFMRNSENMTVANIRKILVIQTSLKILTEHDFANDAFLCKFSRSHLKKQFKSKISSFHKPKSIN